MVRFLKYLTNGIGFGECGEKRLTTIPKKRLYGPDNGHGKARKGYFGGMEFTEVRVDYKKTVVEFGRVEYTL